MKLRKSQMISPKNFFFPPEEMNNSPVEIVLFLKKVHSWGGVTEMVHGSFLSVL